MLNRNKLIKLGQILDGALDEADISAHNLVEWFLDAVAAARDEKPEEKPEEKPLNDPPPPGLPCWVWIPDGSSGEWHLRVGALATRFPKWQPCFVPLDAKPGGSWVLYKDGIVSWFDSTEYLDKYDREVAHYIYTVPGGEA